MECTEDIISNVTELSCLSSIACHNAIPFFAKSLATVTPEENKLRKHFQTKTTRNPYCVKYELKLNNCTRHVFLQAEQTRY